MACNQPSLTDPMTPSELSTVTTVYLVSCVSAKLAKPASAKDLYISTWFRKARAFVEAQHAPWYILSAEHGLLHPDVRIKPYEKTLKKMSVAERRDWAERVIRQMEDNLPTSDRVVALASTRYRELLMGYLKTRAGIVEIPMEGLAIGKQLHWLGQKTPSAAT